MTPEQAASKYHWIKYDEENKVIELFMDHHMLSTLRTCEAKFQLEHILNIRPKGHGAWNLVFGAFLHEVLETFYNSIRDNDGIPLTPVELLEYAREKWLTYKLDHYKDTEDQYDKLGGWEGCASLIVQYYAFYMDLRVRIVATEITFGFEREVPLGTLYGLGPISSQNLEVKCYLTGRIDLLVDNGHKIGIVDHKSHASFRGDEWRKYNPNDAITGYIFAINALMKKQFPEYFEQGKQCMSSWIYHISKATPSKNRKTGIVGPRFKASVIDKVPEQLEEFRLRQLETFKRVCELVFNNKTPEWSTNTCGNIYMRPCEYIPIHESPSKEWGHLITDHYNFTQPWNPLAPDESTIVRDSVMKITEVTNATTEPPVEQLQTDPN